LAVKIRLARHGAKKAPYYRIVVADGRARRDGRFIEILGRYNPRTAPSTVEVDVEKVDAWIAKGAQPTEAVVKLVAIAKGEKQAPVVEAKVSKKAAEKAKAEADAAQKAADEAAAAAVAAEEAAAAEAEAEPAEEAPAEDAAPEEATAEEAPAATDEAAADAEPEAPSDEAAEPAETE
jgi:small subunit ribosomal protein S16